MMLTKICLLGLFSLGVALLFSGRPGPVLAQAPVKTTPSEAIVQFNPPTSRLTPSAQATTEVIVTGISRLYGVELQLSYDPTLVEVVDADPELPGVQVGLGDLFTGGNALVLTNEVTPTGHINVIAARQAPAEPFSGDGSLLTLTWRALSEGKSSLTLETVKLADAEGRPLGVTSQNGRLEVAATAGLTLRGQVELPDRQDYSGVEVSAGSQIVTTAADGAFVLPLAAGQPYTLRFSAPGCLSLQVNGQPLTGPGAFDLGRLVMLGGDATGDDRVDLADLSYVNSRLGSQDSQADLNGDRQVDKLDVAPILANYGRQGPIRMGAPVKPAGVISGAEMPPLTFAPQPNPHLVKLGQALFFDRILSGNRDIACSTCHLPGQNSSDSLSLSIGTGAKGGLGPARELGSGRSFIPRNALDIFNRGAKEWHTLFWDSRVSGSPETGFVTPARSALPPGLDSVLAAQAMFPVTSRDEMRGRLGDVSVTGPPNELAALGDQDFTGIWAVLLARLLAIPEYMALFQAAYPDTPLGEFGFQHAANAIAAFEQDAFTFTNSPWDQYLAGDPSALSEPARRGADLFFGQAGCARCHAGNLFTDQEHHNLGVPQLGPGKGAEAPLDLGRARETKNPLDRFAFRTPSLRNVTLTGPWMHNGAYTSLEDAVRHHLNPEQALRNYQANGLRPELKETVKIDDATVTSLLMTLDPLLASPPPLTDEDVADLLAFLAALTDPAAANLGNLAPASVPSGLPVDSETETEPVAVPAIEAIATPTTPPSPTNPFTATLTAHYSGELAREWMQLLYDRVQADKLSPPVAARIYAYGGITLYESVVAGMPGYRSMQGQLNELSELPQPGTEPYHWPTVAANAMTIVAEALFATADSQAAFAQLRDEQIGASSAEIWPAEALDRSTVYGQQLGQAIVAWLETDGYRETRDKSFTILTGPGRWTPVGDQKPLEPYWGDLRPLALSTPDACQPPAPEPFSTSPTSTFYAQAYQVYEASQKLTSEQKAIALFWADTPGQTGTPPGHWVSIANQIIDQQQLNLGEAARLHALLGIGLADAFISCWQEKYNTFLLRPVSYIQQHIDPDWQPLIPTPPFPEYPSGHSVASAAAAEILTEVLGPLSFTDATHVGLGLPAFNYNSFTNAAEEAAMSRLFGGIHYPMGIENGLSQGQCVGRAVLERIQAR